MVGFWNWAGTPYLGRVYVARRALLLILYTACAQTASPSWSPAPLMLPAGTLVAGTRLFLVLITLKGTNGGLLGEVSPMCAFNLSEPSLCDLHNKAYNTVVLLTVGVQSGDRGRTV